MSTLAEYRRLLSEFVPQPIRSAKDYRRALAQLEKLLVPRPSAARSLLIEVLSTLVEKYELQDAPAPRSTPAAMLAHLLEVNRLKCADLARATGIPPATLSNVLANRRAVSKNNALVLAKHFGVSPVVFLGAPGAI